MNLDSERAFPFADLELSRRLELTEARANAGYVQARAGLSPESGAGWIEVDGALAMFDGPKSPCTQTFGLGLWQPVTHDGLDVIEAFYRQRGSPVFHEVSPLADAETLGLLNERGYRPCELTNVMTRPIEWPSPRPGTDRGRLSVRSIRGDESETWARTSAEGWSESVEFADLVLEMGRVWASRADAYCFLAELEGRAIATGSMTVHGGVALLAGASTIPAGRKQGAQLALLDGRLRRAAELGCDLAMMCALPGSSSQRNAERNGFRVVYTRIKWHLARD